MSLKRKGNGLFKPLYFVDICNILSEDSSEETPLTLLKHLQKDLNHRSCQVKKKRKVHQSSFHV